VLALITSADFLLFSNVFSASMDLEPVLN